MEEKIGEEGREKKVGKGKQGRPSKAKLLRRERSWSIGNGKNIKEFFKRKKEREKGEKEEEG